MSLLNSPIFHRTKIVTPQIRLIAGMVFLLCGMQTAASAAPASDQSELQRGIQSFNSKHYSDAVAHLQFYVNANPHDSMGHYYMANCLFSLGYQQPCIDEYAKALKESTSQKMTDYCRDAIRSMQHQPGQSNAQSGLAAAQPLSSALASATYGLGTNSAQATGVDSAYDARQLNAANRIYTRPSQVSRRVFVDRPDMVSSRLASITSPYILNRQRSDDPMAALNAPLTVPTMSVDPALVKGPNGIADLTLEKTLVRMTDQTNVQIESLQKEAAASQQSIKDHLAEDIIRLNRDQETRITALMNGTSSKSSSSSIDSSIESIKRDTQEKITSAQKTAESNAESSQQEYLTRIGKVMAASKISQDQIADSRRVPGSPNLQVVGSDLYTRNFAPSPEPPPPDELLATPERLVVDAHSHPGRTIYRVVRDPNAPLVAAPTTALKVHGELVR